jgi:hypothetical protein
VRWPMSCGPGSDGLELSRLKMASELWSPVRRTPGNPALSMQ